MGLLRASNHGNPRCPESFCAKPALPFLHFCRHDSHLHHKKNHFWGLLAFWRLSPSGLGLVCAPLALRPFFHGSRPAELDSPPRNCPSWSFFSTASGPHSRALFGNRGRGFLLSDLELSLLVRPFLFRKPVLHFSHPGFCLWSRSSPDSPPRNCPSWSFFSTASGPHSRALFGNRGRGFLLSDLELSLLGRPFLFRKPVLHFSHPGFCLWSRSSPCICRPALLLIAPLFRPCFRDSCMLRRLELWLHLSMGSASYPRAWTHFLERDDPQSIRGCSSRDLHAPPRVPISPPHAHATN